MTPPPAPSLSVPQGSCLTGEVFTDRWEHGSEFHALFTYTGGGPHPWEPGGLRFGSGRDALRALMADGRDQRGWRRMWVPSFFCQEVVGSILGDGLEILPYRAGPEEPRPDLAAVPLRPGDAVLRVDLFGLQALPPLDGQRQPGVEYVDDHTHDPWSESAWRSDADWCLASLRKTVPVPDGAVLWSPAGRRLPPAPALTRERRAASLAKLAAMVIKDSYLKGAAVEKDLFRTLAVQGEEGLGAGEPSAMTPWSIGMMEAMPLAEWRKRRADNHRRLAAALADLPGARVLAPEGETCPYVLVLVFQHADLRDRVKRGLLAARIYPGSHWPMDSPAIPGIPEEHLELSRRVLTLHCDQRYGSADLERVAAQVRQALEA